MKTLAHSLLFPVSAAVLAIGLTLACPANSRAADHGDAPALAQDQGADIADVFAFMDPAGDGKSDVILIATFHGFIAPGEASNFAVFDPNIRYHFEIYNDHVNQTPPALPDNATGAQKAAYKKYLDSIKPNRTIDVTFSKRATDPAAVSTKPNLKTAVAQTATITLGGFSHPNNKGKLTTDTSSAPLLTTPPTLQPTAKDQHVNTVAVDSDPTHNIQFFAGEVDDPFFFDIPAFNALIDSLRDPAVPNTFTLNRGRDTFAGYNCLSIALKIPKALLAGANGTRIGVDFMTQRHNVQMPGTDGPKGVGGFKTVDRMGNPGINVVLLPFDMKNAYNTGTPKTDAQGKFAGAIVETLKELGVTATTPNTSALAVLANVAVAYGDVLQLDTNIANVQTGATGGGGDNAGVGFGTLAGNLANGGGGRRLMDDTIDTVLKVITGNSGASDGTPLDEDGFVPTNTFPFLHVPHQPLANGVLDDGTRN